MFKFRFNKWYGNNDDNFGIQIAILPWFNISHVEKNDKVWAIEIAWLVWCLQVWINGDEDLI